MLLIPQNIPVKRLFLSIISLVIIYGQVGVVSAVDYGFEEPEKLSNREEAHLNIGFTGGGDEVATETVGSCSETSTITLVGNSNLEKIYNYFRDKGLLAEQAAGIVGNIQVESGGNPLRSQTGPDTKDPTQFGTAVGVGKAWGLIQWDAGGRSVEYASQAKITTPIYELSTQLEIVWWHMNNTSPTSAQNMYKDYKNITDIAEATSFYEVKMEGAGTPHMERRIAYAKEALREYGGGGEGTSGGTTGGSICSGEGGIASTENFTFPLITTQSAIKNNSGGLWCHAATENCHHDYKAADLMITTGTKVIAAKDGTVQNVNSGNQHPNNVTITSSDGAGINYYTHLGANTAAVREGQKVKAGDLLGLVGTTVDAMGTPPHLHFDMLPAKYRYRPSCSGSSCSSYPFIEVQPALVETFNKLPEN